jgi:uncharacterized protein (TIGR04562 family)
MAKTDHRIPVISDPDELNIPWRTLQTIIAGRSLIDTFELNVSDPADADRFLGSYGLHDKAVAEELLIVAVEYVETVLLRETGKQLPGNIKELSLAELLLAASDKIKSMISEWSCLLLKVCHAVAHAQWSKDEDAYHAALVKINARLNPFIVESEDGCWIGDKNCRIPIVEYKIKTRKKFFRVVNKLLLKEGNLSARIYDHIGVRFVTNDIFSAILLIKFLRSRNIFMYANLLPRESKNSIAEFHQIEALFSEFTEPVVHSIRGEGKSINSSRENPFSSKEFKMIKIVERVLVTTDSDRKVFFPCEFQILTRQAHESHSKKQMTHVAYEKRQVEGVKKRLFKGTSLLNGQYGEKH